MKPRHISYEVQAYIVAIPSRLCISCIPYFWAYILNPTHQEIVEHLPLLGVVSTQDCEKGALWN